MLKLNLGCGGRRIEGFTGVDAVARPAVDVIAAADKLPFGDSEAAEIMAIHLFEHLEPWNAQGALEEWFRVLKSGGKLVLEMPDIIKCCQNIIDGVMRGGKHPDQLGYWGAYGDPRLKDVYMLHRWGYCFKTIKPMLEKAGFIKVTEHRTQYHPAGRDCRDFRVEAVKP